MGEHNERCTKCGRPPTLQLLVAADKCASVAESESAALRSELASVREAIDGACQYMLGHTYRTADDGKALVQACVDVRSNFAEALQHLRAVDGGGYANAGGVGQREGGAG